MKENILIKGCLNKKTNNLNDILFLLESKKALEVCMQSGDKIVFIDKNKKYYITENRISFNYIEYILLFILSKEENNILMKNSFFDFVHEASFDIDNIKTLHSYKVSISFIKLRGKVMLTLYIKKLK